MNIVMKYSCQSLLSYEMDGAGVGLSLKIVLKYADLDILSPVQKVLKK